MSNEDVSGEPEVVMPEIDLATGMPVVPEGYFWRVKTAEEDYRSNSTIHVSLRKHEPKWWSSKHTTLIAHRDFDAEDRSEKIWIGGYYSYRPASPNQIKDIVLGLAKMVYSDNKNMLQRSEDRRLQESTLKQIVGDYPPKKLD